MGVSVFFALFSVIGGYTCYYVKTYSSANEITPILSDTPPRTITRKIYIHDTLTIKMPQKCKRKHCDSTDVPSDKDTQTIN